MRRAACFVVVALAAMSCGTSSGVDAADGSIDAAVVDASVVDASVEEASVPDASVSVLVFSRTAGYRHPSIADGRAALSQAAAARAWVLESTEDAARFTDTGLAPYDVVVFLSTTGDILDDAQQGAFERFIASGKGWVGVHAAADTEYGWPWYGGLVGAYFSSHPAIQTATVHVEGTHAVVEGLPATWSRSDEWYAFQTNPRANVQVLMTLDESTYDPGGSAMGADHPIAWLHEYGGGRAVYTALGHTSESFSEPLFVGHLTRAIEWAAGR